MAITHINIYWLLPFCSISTLSGLWRGLTTYETKEQHDFPIGGPALTRGIDCFTFKSGMETLHQHSISGTGLLGVTSAPSCHSPDTSYWWDRRLPLGPLPTLSTKLIVALAAAVS